MPRFAANLSMMFQEIGFLDRFDAAARAGFTGVEFLFPYDHPPAAIAERLERNRLSLALFQHGARGLGRWRARPCRAARARAGIPRRGRQGDPLRQGDEMPAGAYDGRAVAGRPRQPKGRRMANPHFSKG